MQPRHRHRPGDPERGGDSGLLLYTDPNSERGGGSVQIRGAPGSMETGTDFFLFSVGTSTAGRRPPAAVWALASSTTTSSSSTPTPSPSVLASTSSSTSTLGCSSPSSSSIGGARANTIRGRSNSQICSSLSSISTGGARANHQRAHRSAPQILEEKNAINAQASRQLLVCSHGYLLDETENCGFVVEMPHGCTNASSFNAHALGALAEVAGPGLSSHIGTILPTLVLAMDNEDESTARKAAETVVLVIDDEGVETLIPELLRGVDDSQASMKRGSAYLIGFLFKNNKLYLADEAPEMMSTLITLLSDTDKATVSAAWEAFSRVVGSVPKEHLPTHKISV